MKISTLIHHLTTISREHGDIPVFNGPNYGTEYGYDLTQPNVEEKADIDYEYGKEGDTKVVASITSGTDKVVLL